MEDSTPIGSVCLIEDDMVQRPYLTPWLAALYMRHAYRNMGMGSLLVNHLVDRARSAGFDELYLNADDQMYVVNLNRSIER